MRQHQKYVEDLEPDGGYGEEVDGHRALDVILKESPPCLRGRPPTVDHVLADTGFADVNPQFEEFAVDARGSRRSPVAPKPAQPSPEEPVRGGQLRSLLR